MLNIQLSTLNVQHSTIGTFTLSPCHLVTPSPCQHFLPPYHPPHMSQPSTETLEESEERLAALPVDLNASPDEIASKIEEISAGEAARLLQSLPVEKAADVAEALD